MKAAVFHRPHERLRIEDLVIDAPAANEVLIRVAAAGLCHSDLHFIEGDMPHKVPAVIGHESAGIIESVGSEVVGLAPGDHVVCCASIFCGACTQCLSSRSNRCTDRPVRHADDRATLSSPDYGQLSQHGAIGGFAEKMLVHQHAVVKVPKQLPLDRAALLGCGVMTGLGAVFNSAEVKPGSSVAVIGCGGVGLNVIQGARIAGARQIIAIDLSPEKLNLAKTFGATDGVSGGPDAIGAVKALSGGGVDHVFEVVGRTDTMEQGLAMLGMGGLLTVLGVTAPDAKFAVPPVPLMYGEWRIQGSRLGSGPFRRDIPRFADLYLRGQLDLDSLISERIPLDQINEGFERMLTGNGARSVILFDEVMQEANAHLSSPGQRAVVA